MPTINQVTKRLDEKRARETVRVYDVISKLENADPVVITEELTRHQTLEVPCTHAPALENALFILTEARLIKRDTETGKYCLK